MATQLNCSKRRNLHSAENGHYEKILFMESASVRARAAPWKAGSGSALKLCIKDTVS
jgi:hypothetical protein